MKEPRALPLPVPEAVSQTERLISQGVCLKPRPALLQWGVGQGRKGLQARPAFFDRALLPKAKERQGPPSFSLLAQVLRSQEKGAGRKRVILPPQRSSNLLSPHPYSPRIPGGIHLLCKTSSCC